MPAFSEYVFGPAFLALQCILVALGQQQPPRTCINTGLTCIENCVADGIYQWCGSCQWFIQCTGEIAYYTPCNANLYFHNDVKACVSVSDTCTECVIHTSPNGLTDSTIKMTTIIGRRIHTSNNNIHNSYRNRNHIISKALLKSLAHDEFS